MHVCSEPMATLFAVLLFSFCAALAWIGVMKRHARPRPFSAHHHPLRRRRHHLLTQSCPSGVSFSLLFFRPSCCGRCPSACLCPTARVPAVCVWGGQKRQQVAAAAAVLPPASCASPSATALLLSFHALFRSVWPGVREAATRLRLLTPSSPRPPPTIAF